MQNKPSFKSYYEKHKREELGSIYNLIVIMRYLEKYENYDFSKPLKHTQNDISKKKKKYIMKSDNGTEYYL